MKPIIGILGPSGVGKTKMVDLLAETGDFHVLRQITMREARNDDDPRLIQHCSPHHFNSLHRDSFLVRHGSYGILKDELSKGDTTGKPMVGVMGVFEIIQLKSLFRNSISALLQFPGVDTTEIKKRVRERTNYPIEDRIFENAVYQDVFYNDPDFLQEYVDLNLISVPSNNNDNIALICLAVAEMIRVA